MKKKLQFEEIEFKDNMFVIHNKIIKETIFDFKKKIETTGNMYKITSNQVEKSMIIEKCEFEKLRWWIHVNFNK